jgi:hypothetical protein
LQQNFDSAVGNHAGEKMAATIEVTFSLTKDIVMRLHERAQRWGMSDAAVVEQALGLLFDAEDPASLQDYWFSVATMDEDWAAMPEDWALEVDDAIPAR